MPQRSLLAALLGRASVERREPVAKREPTAPHTPLVRRLEPRRVLNAAVTALIAPSILVEGDSANVVADAVGGVGPLEFDWTVTVDGQVVQRSNARELPLTTADDGVYEVTVAVTDQSNAPPAIAATTINVLNAPPRLTGLSATPSVEGGVTVLTGTIEDAGADDTFTLDIDWGDGETQTVSLAVNERTFAVPHTYADDNADDLATISVVARDDDGGFTSGVVTTTVGNTGPRIDDLLITPVDEGGVATLSGTIFDAGVEDTFTVTVEWGDGAIDTFALAADARDFSFTHRYTDDRPTGTPADTFPVVINVQDDDGNGEIRFPTTVVSNVAPSIVRLTATDLDEGGQTRLIGQFVDPGVEDTFTVEIDWGDGSPVDTVMLSGADREFEFTHRYTDDRPTGTPADRPTIRATVLDDDGGVDVATVSPLVRNVAPQIVGLMATDTLEGGATTLTGSIVDPGAEDTFTLVVNWGDGQSDSLSLGPTERAFVLDHGYADDDPTGTPVDRPTIRVTVVDDDTGESGQTVRPSVRNVAPRIVDAAATDVTEGGRTVLTGRVADPGVNDTFTLLVDWDDGQTDTLTLAADERDFRLEHLYVDDNPSVTPADRPTIRLTVLDDDTGDGRLELTPLVSNAAPIFAPTADRALSEGDTLTLSDFPVRFTDVGVADTFTAEIVWGDGSPSETLTVTFADGAGRIDGSHVYADDGVYTATITLTDDDSGVATAAFSVSVGNIDPVLTGADDLVVDEGAKVDLATLGVGVTDPGFDNPDNTNDPGNGGEVSEFFLDGVIDWGDGTPTTPVRFAVTDPGQPGEPTIATPVHAPHFYADNGVYTVTVSFSDDDGPIVNRTLSILVENVAPSLTIDDPGVVIDEGTGIELVDFARFTDPGFNNALNVNDPANGGQIEEFFSVTIDWGDNTTPDVFRLDDSVTQGGSGESTRGLISANHFYADNDRDGTPDNRYTVTVTLEDDDGGVDVQTFHVTVFNVAPTLDPITATDLESDGVTTLDLTFSDPGADEFEILVDWGERLDLPADERFVVEQLYAGPTPESFTINHRYFGPPDPQNPTADIIIRVKIRDDDFSTTALVIGESNVRDVPISNSGIEDNRVAIDTTPQAPEIRFPERVEPAGVVERVVEPPATQTVSLTGAASSDAGVGTERYLELRIVRPDGGEGTGYRLPDDTLTHLPELFARLPDNRYRVYVVEASTETRRLVIDVSVRGGRVIDPTDDSDGGRDRPPPSATTPAPPAAPAAKSEPAGEAAVDVAAVNPPAIDSEPFDAATDTAPVDTASSSSHPAAATTAAAALALSRRRARIERIARFAEQTDDVAWRRLFRRRPR
ncbi:MAG: hypothetical protein AAFV43_12545 [Planctomycetota bacterium]